MVLVKLFAASWMRLAPRFLLLVVEVRCRLTCRSSKLLRQGLLRFLSRRVELILWLIVRGNSVAGILSLCLPSNGVTSGRSIWMVASMSLRRLSPIYEKQRVVCYLSDQVPTQEGGVGMPPTVALRLL